MAIVRLFSKKEMDLLRRINKTDEVAIKLARSIIGAAGPLVKAGLAVCIPRSQGGVDVCLTTLGKELAEGK